jgi:hypothetical protein
MTADFRKVFAHPGPCNSDYTTWFFEIALLSGPLSIFTQGIWYDIFRTAVAQQQSALLHAFVHPSELNAEWAYSFYKFQPEIYRNKSQGVLKYVGINV